MAELRSRWYDDTTSIFYRLFLLATPAFCALAAVLATHFDQPMGHYWTGALNLAAFGHVGQHFTPAGYPELLAIGTSLLPAHPVLSAQIIQSLLHVVLTILICTALIVLRVQPRLALAAALLLQLDPELLLNVNKIWDVSYSTALFLAIVLTTLQVLRRPRSPAYLCLCGICLGLGVFERPNFMLLLPSIFLALWITALSHPRRKKFLAASLRTLVVAAIAFGVFTLSAYRAYGRLDMPRNGPYNLFAGQNPLAKASLLAGLNAEGSIQPSLRANGIFITEAEAQSDAMQPVFLALSKDFALHHPAAELQLIAIKFFTVFRPDSKAHALATPAGLVKLLLALPAPLWLCSWIYLFAYQRKPLTSQDLLILSFAAFYVLPFLITNSDPRLRTPLDILLLIHTFALWTRTSPPQSSVPA